MYSLIRQPHGVARQTKLIRWLKGARSQVRNTGVRISAAELPQPTPTTVGTALLTANLATRAGYEALERDLRGLRRPQCRAKGQISVLACRQPSQDDHDWEISVTRQRLCKWSGRPAVRPW